MPDANFAPGRRGWGVDIGQEGRCVAAQHRTGKTFEKRQVLNPCRAVERFYKRLIYKKFGFKLVNSDVFVGTITVGFVSFATCRHCIFGATSHFLLNFAQAGIVFRKKDGNITFAHTVAINAVHTDAHGGDQQYGHP